MANFYVLTGLRDAGLGGIPGGKRAYTAAEAEAQTQDKRFTSAVKVFGPIQDARIVEIGAATATQAAQFARVVLHLQVTGVVPVAELPITQTEAAEKAGKTVPAANLENVAAE